MTNPARISDAGIRTESTFGRNERVVRMVAVPRDRETTFRGPNAKTFLPIPL